MLAIFQTAYTIPKVSLRQIPSVTQEALITQELENAKNRDDEPQVDRQLREFVPAVKDADKVSDESSDEQDGQVKTEREAAPV